MAYHTFTQILVYLRFFSFAAKEIKLVRDRKDEYVAYDLLYVELRTAAQ